MKTKRAADFIFAVFFTVMLLLTMFAEDLYRLTLPKVAVEEVTRRAFAAEMTGKDGAVYETWRTVPAIPTEALLGDYGDMVYAVNETENGLILVEYIVSTGEESEGYIEITGGILTGTLAVIGSDREIYPGQQVIITGWDESVALHTARERGEDISGYVQEMRKRLLTDIVCVVGVIPVTVVAVLLCNRFCKGRWRFLKVPALIVWCILVCLFLRATILLPGEWIPEKLIDWEGWKTNRESFQL
ncbi:MAG: hypothetical protein IKT67_07785 [Lachnospiraceae bacterium]|nr:hypothetical protein [Lachnospiraceae bacterium]